MVEAANNELTERQREILRRVVEEYVASGQPVGSKTLVDAAGMSVSPSTVRAELAELERSGCSRTRTPRPAACRPRPATGSTPTRCSSGSSRARARSRSTSPPRAASSRRRSRRRRRRSRRRRGCSRSSPRRRSQTATVRHVEVLVLQPQVVMVVVITSTGGVSKRVLHVRRARRPRPRAVGGRVPERAASAGLELGTRRLRRRLRRPGPLARGSASSSSCSGRRSRSLDGRADQRLFVGGAASLLGEVRADELEACQRLLEALEKRAALLEMLGEIARLAAAVRPRRRASSSTRRSATSSLVGAVVRPVARERSAP